MKMKNPGSSSEIGPQILQALGLPSERCQSATIYLIAGEDIVITASYYADGDKEIALDTRRFVLIEDLQPF